MLNFGVLLRIPCKPAQNEEPTSALRTADLLITNDKILPHGCVACSAEGLKPRHKRDRFGIIYYHLRYHLWAGVRRDWSGTNSTTTEQKAPRRDQTGPDGTKGKHGTPSYESEGRRFESCRARQRKSCKIRSFLSSQMSCDG